MVKTKSSILTSSESKFGYARVSTVHQNLELQTDALHEAGCVRVFMETMSGARANRPELVKLLDLLRPGDTLVVWKLDRLGRSLMDLIRIITDLQERGIEFVSLTEHIDTTTPHGRFFFHIAGAFAEFEREMIRERTQAGLKAAHAKGRFGGRPVKMTAGKLRVAKELRNQEQTYLEIAATLGLSRATVSRHLRR